MKVVRYKLSASTKCKYKVALVSDLHGNLGLDAISVLHHDKPDTIAIAGDLVDTKLRENRDSISFLQECTKIAFTVLSLGNHDFLIDKNDFEIMNQVGVHLLNDSWVQYNDGIVIGGMTSSFYHKCEKYDPKIPMELFPETEWLDEFENQRGYKILLDHHPENYEQYTRKRDIDLILSGHNHGGQIRLFGRGLYARNQGLFPKYDGGLYDNKLVVSRGLSNIMPIPRLWNPTELVYVELIPTKAEGSKL